MSTELERIWNSTPEQVASPDRRHALILLAQGPDRNDDAVLDLFAHYVGTLRNAVARFVTLDPDESRQLALLSLLVTADRYDPSVAYGSLPRLISLVLDACWTALAEDVVIPVEGRTLRRYRAAVRKANGELTTAEELAGQYGVGRDTFRLIAANQRSASLSEVDRQVRLADSGADALELAQQALAVLSPRDRAIVQYSYGFVDGVPHSDNETAEYLRSSQVTVQRRRTSAILAMRDALGVGPRRSAS